MTTYVLLRFDDDEHAERFQRELADELVVIDDRRFPDSSPTQVHAVVVTTYSTAYATATDRTEE